MQLPVYLDNNATTPCDPRVVEAMLPYFSRHFGNAASRNHAFGWEAEEAVAHAREQVAGLIGAHASEIVFTSGATESDNLALKGVFERYAGKGNHIITVSTEHKAVLDTCAHIEKQGGDVTCLPVDADGLIDLGQLEAAIKPATILIAVMYANNETGVLQPIRAISAIARRHGVLFFSDAAQAAAKVPVDVNSDGIDLLALSAHKLYGPKGVGALYVRRRDPRVQLNPQMDGGGHERGQRSGTLNVPGIVGFGAAAALASAAVDIEAARLGALRNRLENALLELDEVYVNGSTLHRLPHVSNLSFRYLEGDALLMGFNKNIAVSSGSACTSASLEPSYVLKAMGRDDAEAWASVRFGLGRFTDEAQVEYAIAQVKQTVRQMRQESPLWEMYKGKATSSEL